jgi:UDP-N-acetyl-D-galactosamine dehydrogenase
MNELAMVFDRMGIDTKEVIEAMNTKWNALGFTPGLVGGHCIGVDPYYFVYEAEKLGYHSQIILSGRKINDGMGKFVADAIIKKLILANKVVRQAKVVILGITFKENTPDTRNSKVVDIIDSLREYGIEPIVVDPEADADEAKHEYDIDLTDIKEVKNADCLVLAVAHDIFKRMSLNEVDSLYGDYKNSEKVLIDVKSIFDREEIKEKGYSYWRL